MPDARTHLAAARELLDQALTEISKAKLAGEDDDFDAWASAVDAGNATAEAVAKIDGLPPHTEVPC